VGGRVKPSALQIELFRTMEDIHELTMALVVLLVDEEGRSVAVSGDELEIPSALRAALSGKALAAAGSVVALLSNVSEALVGSPLNVTIYDVGRAHVLAIVFDAEAEFETVQTVGAQAKESIAELLRAD
jgi:predicted regulator of Ras-like GTPase activity (Roadblock/LC7/MglB family)